MDINTRVECVYLVYAEDNNFVEYVTHGPDVSSPGPAQRPKTCAGRKCYKSRGVPK